MASVVAIPSQWLFAPLLVLLFNAQDITQSAEDVATRGAAQASSPWQLAIGIIPPALWFFVILLVVLSRLRAADQRVRDLPSIIYFVIVVPLITALYYQADGAFDQVVSDAKVPVFFFVTLAAGTRYFDAFPHMIQAFCQLAACLSASRFTLDAVYLFLGAGRTLISDVDRISTDSAKGMVALWIFLLFSRLISGRSKWVSVLLLPVSIYLLLSYQTRWLVLSLACGVILVIAWLNVRRAVYQAIIGTVSMILALPILTTIRPETLEILSARFSSMEIRDRRIDIEAVDATRTASIINAINTLSSRYAFLTGLGLGSYYTDEYYPMPTLNEGDFDVRSLSGRKFYRIHDFTFYFLFKFGLIGLLLYGLCFLKPIAQMYKARAWLRRDPVTQRTCIVIIGLLPTVLTTLFWTAKGLIISALYVALARAWIQRGPVSRMEPR